MTEFYSVVITTFPNQESLDKTSLILIESGLAACIQYFDITSMYLWNGKTEKEKEKLVFIKTKSSLFDKVSAIIQHGHPYETPELIQLPIEKISEGYQIWMDSVLKKPM